MKLFLGSVTQDALGFQLQLMDEGHQTGSWGFRGRIGFPRGIVNDGGPIIGIRRYLTGESPKLVGSAKDAAENGVFVYYPCLYQRLVERGGHFQEASADPVQIPARLIWSREQTQNGGVQTVACQDGDRVRIHLQECRRDAAHCLQVHLVNSKPLAKQPTRSQLPTNGCKVLDGVEGTRAAAGRMKEISNDHVVL